MKVLIAIPMRSISKRLARKLFKAETGKPVALHALEAAMETAKLFSPAATVFGIADGQLYDFMRHVAPGEHLSQHNGDFQNGTQRVFSWLTRRYSKWHAEFDCVVNWQADEPLIAAADVFKAAKHAVEAGRITTLGMDGLSKTEAIDPDIVKVHASGDQAKGFTRSQVPRPPLRRLRHIGLYAFPRCAYDIAPLDMTAQAKLEGLEQLTWLEAGAKVDVLVATETLKQFGGHFKIDSVKDYRLFVEKVKAML